MHRAGTALIRGLAACGGEGSTGPGPSNTAGTFTAVIGGQNWASTTNQTVGATGQNQVPGLITITGTRVVSASDATTITLTVGYLAGPGTYPLGVNFISTAGGSAHVSTLQGTTTSTWSTGFSGSAGTIAVTSLTSNRIVGTFQFNAPPQQFTSATGTKVVTTGAIDMPLPAGFAPAPPDNRGNKASAAIGGSSWNAATVLALGGNGIFSLSAMNDTYTVNLSPGRVVTAGNTYSHWRGVTHREHVGDPSGDIAGLVECNGRGGRLDHHHERDREPGVGNLQRDAPARRRNDGLARDQQRDLRRPRGYAVTRLVTRRGNPRNALAKVSIRPGLVRREGGRPS